VRTFKLLISLIPLFLAFTGSAVAQPNSAAGASMNVSVEVLHATNSKPAKVAVGFESLVKRPPWNSYSSFELMQRSTYVLTVGKKQKVALPGGGSLELALRSGGTKPQFDYSLNGGGNASAVATAGQKMALNGGTAKDGSWIVVIGF
jgi:hypothetical protein